MPAAATAKPPSPAKIEHVRYAVHPSIAYIQAIRDNLPTRTGKSLGQWIALLKKSAPKDDTDRIEWLKKQHKLGGTTAWIVADAAAGRSNEDTDPAEYLNAAKTYVQNLYAGDRAALFPIHRALLRLGLSLGGDVKVCPCKTIVPLYRHHVFAEIKPATKTRIDFGLCLRGASGKIPARFKDTGGQARGDRITHRAPITSLDEIDDQVRKWARVAYEMDRE